MLWPLNRLVMNMCVWRYVCLTLPQSLARQHERKLDTGLWIFNLTNHVKINKQRIILHWIISDYICDRHQKAMGGKSWDQMCLSLVDTSKIWKYREYARRPPAGSIRKTAIMYQSLLTQLNQGVLLILFRSWCGVVWNQCVVLI